MHQLIDDFNKWLPSIARHAISYHEGYRAELIIELDDGDWISYDGFNRTVRNLPFDSNDMSEIEFRREFGIRLSDIMWHKGVSETRLAELTGISQVSISNYITGKTTPSFYIVDKIAKVLGCSTEAFRYVV